MAREPLKASGQKATALIFIAHDCPASNGYAPEINRLCADFGAKGIAFFIVYAETDLARTTAVEHAAAYGFKCPALLDTNLALVKKSGATVTPEAAVFSPAGTLLYRGRIDDRDAEIGRHRPAPTTHDLRDALDAILENKPVPVPITKPVGCYISG